MFLASLGLSLGLFCLAQIRFLDPREGVTWGSSKMNFFKHGHVIYRRKSIFDADFEF